MSDVDWTPLTDEFLNRTGKLTEMEMILISENIDWSGRVVNQCNPKDQDVLAWHEDYLHKLIARLNDALKYYGALIK